MGESKDKKWDWPTKSQKAMGETLGGKETRLGRPLAGWKILCPI